MALPNFEINNKHSFINATYNDDETYQNNNNVGTSLDVLGVYCLARLDFLAEAATAVALAHAQGEIRIPSVTGQLSRHLRDLRSEFQANIFTKSDRYVHYEDFFGMTCSGSEVGLFPSKRDALIADSKNFISGSEDGDETELLLNVEISADRLKTYLVEDLEHLVDTLRDEDMYERFEQKAFYILNSDKVARRYGAEELRSPEFPYEVGSKSEAFVQKIWEKILQIPNQDYLQTPVVKEAVLVTLRDAVFKGTESLALVCSYPTPGIGAAEKKRETIALARSVYRWYRAEVIYNEAYNASQNWEPNAEPDEHQVENQHVAYPSE